MSAGVERGLADSSPRMPFVLHVSSETETDAIFKPMRGERVIINKTENQSVALERISFQHLLRLSCFERFANYGIYIYRDGMVATGLLIHYNKTFI